MLDTVIHNDCLSVLRGMADNSVDAIISDPPAGISFMGVGWDTYGEGKGQARTSDEWDVISSKEHPRTAKDTHRIAMNQRKAFIAFLREVMTEALRVLKPGGHALIWALPRTSHWTATALEDAGFEVRDKLYHLFGSGFPKSTAIDKQIDKMAPRQGMFTAFAQHFQEQRKVSGLSQKLIAQHFPSKTGGMTGCVWNWENGANVPTLEQWRILQPMLNLSDEWTPLIEREEAEREVVGNGYRIRKESTVQIAGLSDGEYDITKPATPEAQRWQGYGTALKPSCEEWILVRKPLAESSIAAQVLATGTGGLNIGQTRVGLQDGENTLRKPVPSKGWKNTSELNGSMDDSALRGRFPSHLLLSHSVFCQPTSCEPDLCPIAELDRQSGVRKSKAAPRGGTSPNPMSWGQVRADGDKMAGYDDQGGASRYFQCFPPMVDNDDTSLYNRGNTEEVNQWQKQTHGGTTANEITDGTDVGESQEVASNTDNLSIDGFGNSQTEQSPQDTRYTTSTTMQPITDLKTSNSLPLNGTTITTNDSEKTIVSMSKELRSDGVSDASDTNPLTNLMLEAQEPITDTASHAQLNKSKNGATRTENTTSNVDANTTTVTKGQLEPGHESNNRYFTNFPPDDYTPFLYQAKASRAERNKGCEDLPEEDKWMGHANQINGSGNPAKPIRMSNTHPTVKPLQLMRWLIRLITPPDGIVLDPFCGSGSTCVAAIHEGKHFIGIEQSEEYCTIANARIAHAQREQGVTVQAQEYDCAPGCPVRILGEQSGERSASWRKNKHGGWQSEYVGGQIETHISTPSYKDEGTAARYFQQFAPDLWTQDMQDAEEVFIAEGGYEDEVSV